MAFSSLEPLYISSNSSSNELLECKNNLFKDLIPNNKDNALSLSSFILSSSSSSKYPAKRRKLWAINIWKLGLEPNNQETLVNSKGR